MLVVKLCKTCGNFGLEDDTTEICLCGSKMIKPNISKEKFLKMSDDELLEYMRSQGINPIISREDVSLIWRASKRNREVMEAMIELKQKDIIEYSLKLVEFQAIIDRIKENNIKNNVNNTPRCPTCQSYKIYKISTASKVTNTVLFGIFGNKRKKEFHCNNCGYEW